MAKVASARPASQRTRSRTSVSEASAARARSASDASLSVPAQSGQGEPHVWHCDIKGCSKFFMREADLRRHQRTSKQHNNKAYYCGCGRSFTRQDATRRHCLSFGHEIPASVLRGIPDDGPPTATEPEEAPADGIALLMAAAASLSSAHSASSEVSDSYSSEADADADADADGDDDPEELTSSSASSSLLLMKHSVVGPAVASDTDLTPVTDSRKRKFTVAEEPLLLDLVSSWSSMDTLPPTTPSTQVSLSPVDTRSSSSFSRQRTPSEPHPLRRSHTFDAPDGLNSAVVDQFVDATGRPLNRTKRSRSLFEGQLDVPATHVSRGESRSESAAYEEPGSHLGRYT